MSEKIQIMETRFRAVRLHLRDDIESFSDYDDMFQTLDDLTENEHCSILVNCPGGRCDIGFSLADAMLSCKAKVDVIVEYPSYSMGSILALCGNSLTMGPNTFLMFHDYSGGTYGKGEDTFQQNTNYRATFKSRFKRLCKPFLTEKECNSMFAGKDIYIHNDDPTLPARIKRHFH